MFADAVEKAMKFTRPVIISYRTLDGTVVSSCASFVMLNREGWMVTAGHVFDSVTRYNKDAEKIRRANAANADGTEHVKMDPKWVTNQSFWWGCRGRRDHQERCTSTGDRHWPCRDAGAIQP